MKKITRRQLLPTITIHPKTPPGIAEPPRQRRLRAHATEDTFLLLDGTLDLGLAPGDEMRCVRESTATTTSRTSRNYARGPWPGFWWPVRRSARTIARRSSTG